jgi:cyclophilin family peptidyl-prolyl cis-trans isomerase
MRHRLNASVVIVATSLALLSCCLHPAHAAGLPSWLGGKTTAPETIAAPAQPTTPAAVTPVTPVASDPSLPDWVIAIQQNPELASQNGAIVDTQRGSITFRFYEKEAPITVANFKRLAAKDFYNVPGMKFHRVVENFVVQTGDPTGTGFGGSKDTIPLEAKNKLVHDTLGVVSMARGPLPDSATSQFYITLAKQVSLDGKYAIFGEVVQGLEVLHQIKQGDKVYGVRLTTLPTDSGAVAPLQDRKAFAKALDEQTKLAKRETKAAEKLAEKEAKRQQQEAFQRREEEQRMAAQQAKVRANETAKQLAQQAKASSVQTSSSNAKAWWKVF